MARALMIVPAEDGGAHSCGQCGAKIETNYSRCFHHLFGPSLCGQRLFERLQPEPTAADVAREALRVSERFAASESTTASRREAALRAAAFFRAAVAAAPAPSPPALPRSPRVEIPIQREARARMVLRNRDGGRHTCGQCGEQLGTQSNYDGSFTHLLAGCAQALFDRLEEEGETELAQQVALEVVRMGGKKSKSPVKERVVAEFQRRLALRAEGEEENAEMPPAPPATTDAFFEAVEAAAVGRAGARLEQPASCPSPPPPPPRREESAKLHEPQRAAAQQLFDLMRAGLRGREGQFDSFQCVIVTANKLSLVAQTQRRTRHRVLAATWARGGQALDELFAEIEASPRTLYLLVQDESHWAAGADKIGDGVLQRASRVAKGAGNLLTLLVSATPYVNWVRSGLLPEHCVALHSEGYSSLRSLAEDDEQWFAFDPEAMVEQVGGEFGSQLEQFRGSVALSNLSVFAHIALDYCASLALAVDSSERDDAWCRHWSQAPTLAAVERMLRRNELIVLCMPTADLAEQMARVLQATRRSLGLDRVFAVAVSDSRHSLDAGFLFSSLGTSGAATGGALFSDLEGLPGVLVLVDQGRMGDTLPGSWAAYDVRSRYRRQVHSLAAFRQHLGRACGYGRRPVVLSTTAARATARDGGLASKPDHYLSRGCPSADGEGEEEEEEEEPWAAYRRFVQAHFVDGQPSEAFVRRHFLLQAEMQAGKTGAFLHLAELFEGLFARPKGERAPRGGAEWDPHPLDFIAAHVGQRWPYGVDVADLHCGPQLRLKRALGAAGNVACFAKEGPAELVIQRDDVTAPGALLPWAGHFDVAVLFLVGPDPLPFVHAALSVLKSRSGSALYVVADAAATDAEQWDRFQLRLEELGFAWVEELSRRVLQSAGARKRFCLCVATTGPRPDEG